MIHPDEQDTVKKAISDRIHQDSHLLTSLRDDVRPLLGQTHRIQPRQTTALSLVATDGGQNQVVFDPFLVQLIRVVDSANNAYFTDVVTPASDIDELSRSHWDGHSQPQTELGRMMQALDVKHLHELSAMFPKAGSDNPPSPRWVEVYRELVEWAVLLEIVNTTRFGSDTLLVFDGLLRSKVFRGNLFNRFAWLLSEAMKKHWHQRRKIYLVGLAKHSKVLTRYRLAMALEGILQTPYPAYVEVPRALEEAAYTHADYARGDDIAGDRLNRFVAGKMFFVKFGSRPHDPIWPVDIFEPMRSQAAIVLGHLLSDAVNGFPVPFYPLCLQRAHENAALVDFDYSLLQDHIIDSIRSLLGENGLDLDAFRLQDTDPSQARYWTE